MSLNWTGIITTFENNDLVHKLSNSGNIATSVVAGKYCAIDFPISFMANAGIKNVHILSSENCRPLRKHIEVSKSWGLNRKNGGLFLQTSNVRTDSELLSENIQDVLSTKEEMVVLASADMVTNINLREVIDFHETNNADITVIYKNIPEFSNSFLGCDILDFNENKNLVRVHNNFLPKKNENVSLKIFLIKKSLLLSLLLSTNSTDISLKNILYRSKNKLNILGFEHKGYIACLNSLSNYFKTNMDMKNADILKELFFDENRPVYSKITDSLPTHYTSNSNIKNSIISNECYIAGNVIDSVLSRYVTIEKDATVENCIIFNGATIKSGSHLKNLIIDTDVILETTELEGNTSYPLIVKKNYKF